MTISVPVEIIPASVTTSVTDATEEFDNTLQRSFPTGVKLRNNLYIYTNIGATYSADTYVGTNTYALDDVVYKDGYVQKFKWVSDVQPSGYLNVDNGFDLSTWQYKYSKLFTIPADVPNNKTISIGGSDDTINSVRWSPDGLKMSLIHHIYDGQYYNIKNYNLTTPFKLDTATLNNSFVLTGASALLFGPSGTSCYIVVNTEIRKYNCPTPYRVDVTTLLATYTRSNSASGYMYSSIAFNSNGTKFYEANYDVLTQTTLTTAYDLNTRTSAVSYTANDDILEFSFNTTGTQIYLSTGYNSLYYRRLTLSTAWAINTIGAFNEWYLPTRNGRLYLTAHPSDDTKFFLSGAGSINELSSPTASSIKVLIGSTANLISVMTKISSVWVAHTISMVTRPYYSSSVRVYDSNGALLGSSYLSNDVLNLYSVINSDSIITPAKLVTVGGINTWVAQTVINDGLSMYVRTSVAVSEPLTGETLLPVIVGDVSELPTFSQLAPTNNYSPLDGKNYTYAIASTSMTYRVSGVSKFDTVALGRVKADTATFNFYDANGVIIGASVVNTIDASRDISGNLPTWHTTTINYSNSIVDIGGYVDVILSGDSIELGTLMLGMSVDAGFTNLELQNSFIDYSVYQEDTWGNIDYVPRAKIAVYKGSCDIPITSYDMTDRLLTSLGGSLIILNGSDAKNTVPDNQSVFASTQKIGRLFDLSQQTKLKGNGLDKMATYSFTLKELV